MTPDGHFDRDETMKEIAALAISEQRRGDADQDAGLNERAAIHYARAKVASEGYLLQGMKEVGDFSWCDQTQKLLFSAQRYELVRWQLTDDDDEED
jgi:hypothetical protein